MTTRMVHPLHGATHAYDAGEVEKLKGLGWLIEALANSDTSKQLMESAAKEAMPALKAQIEADILAAPGSKKRGRQAKAK